MFKKYTMHLSSSRRCHFDEIMRFIEATLGNQTILKRGFKDVYCALRWPFIDSMVSIPVS